MITARTTRLVRAADLRTFRDAVVALACDGPPLAARDRLVVVPTRAAGAHLLRSIENRRLASTGAVLLPDLITPGELPARFAERLSHTAAPLSAAEREVLLGVACRRARDLGAEPPFRLRPGLIAEILRFYDALRRNQVDIDAFERRTLDKLEPGAEYDRGAQRLARQTRFLVAAFREFERCSELAGGADEHSMRRAVMATPADRPWRHVVLTVTDGAEDSHGLCPADWDLLARIPGLECLDVVVTDAMLAGAFHQRIHQILPGIDEVRLEGEAPAGEPATLHGGPVLLIPAHGSGLTWVARDREEEVAGFARWARRAVRDGEVDALDKMALVVKQPLPYVYLAREVWRSAGIPCQTFDALPLAAEPYSAAVDLIFSAMSGNFARVPGVALLRSPHFRFIARGDALRVSDVAALDRALSSAGYLGDLEALDRLVSTWRGAGADRGVVARALPAAEALLDIGRQLLPLRAAAAVADHLDVLLAFVTAHEHLPGPDEPLRARQLRARAAILGIFTGLRDAYRRFDDAPVELDHVAALVRRWIEGHTFSPRTGESGVHLVDAESARFGDFDCVQLAGLVDGEWPDRPRRNIFYSSAILRELGWPAESERLDRARSAFADLLRLPSARVVVSTFSLENDANVSPSTLIDELDAAGLDAVEVTISSDRIFEYEGLGMEPLRAGMLAEGARRWAGRRVEMRPATDARFRGVTSGYAATAYSLSALERYQDCPFKFFAGEVLRLDELPEDESSMSPRTRGRFIHEVFERFFHAWDRQGSGTITPDRLDQARALFIDVATPLLDALPDADAALERTRLFGSAISTGIADVVLGLEASRPADVQERWLEYRLEGEFSLGTADGTGVLLRGVADRIDLLAGNRLRVIDYKTGYPPEVKRALQVPIYALCAQERLTQRDGEPWTVDEAAYVAFSGKRTLVPVIKAGSADRDSTLSAARDRLFDVLAGVRRGEFPPRPHEPRMCSYCAYPSVCRKDYVGDD